MADETSITTGMKGTSATVEGAGVSITTEGPIRNIKEMLLYKIDRTLAVLGIISLGIWALMVGTNEAIQIASAATGFLGGFISGRGK